MFWINASRYRRIEKELKIMNKHIKKIIEEIRQSKTVQDGLIVQNRELRAALEEAQKQLADAEADPASVDEAIELLDAMEAEGQAALAENTDGTFTPSGNFEPSGN